MENKKLLVFKIIPTKRKSNTNFEIINIGSNESVKLSILLKNLLKERRAREKLLEGA